MAEFVVFAAALEAFSNGTLDVLSDDLEAVLVDGAWTPDALLESLLTQVPAGVIISSSQNLTGRTVGGARLRASSLVFPAVTVGNTARGLLVYRNSDDLLLSWHHARADDRPIAIATDGSDLEWQWSADGVLTI